MGLWLGINSGNLEGNLVGLKLVKMQHGNNNCRKIFTKIENMAQETLLLDRRKNWGELV